MGIFKEIKTFTLYNHEATKENILNSFSKIKDISKEQDLFVFYYAGHGVMGEGIKEQSKYYLVPSDVTRLYGNEELLKNKALSSKELNSLSQSLNAQKQLFILDACQSGGALEDISKRGVAEEKAIAQLARSTGTFWITASGTEQFATELEELGHGVFTYALLEGLSGKADGGLKDGSISVSELSTYIQERVPSLAEKYKGVLQYPVGYSYGNDFPLVTVSGKIIITR